VCGSREARPRFEVGGTASLLVVCTRCGLGRLHPLPGPAELSSFYPDEYYGEPGRKFQSLVEGAVRFLGGRHVSFLSRSLPRGARVLDVGCGRGVVLGALADRGFEVHGVELSAGATRGADPRARIRIAARLADAGYAEGFFDEVLLWHVLEHLPDPRGTLAEVFRILRPGGRLVVALPNFTSLQARCSGVHWFHLDLPRHLHHFPVAALRRLLEELGFEVESEHHFSLRQNPFGWIQSLLNRLGVFPRNALYTLLQRRPAGAPLPFGAGTCLALLASFAVLVPPALLASLLAAALRSGATIHLVASKRGAAALPQGPEPSSQARPPS
jgi:2-polyprenyl-3-methyl-5-hydroxy-6-metoxy-1,4-benzoquinol methylase